MTYKNNVIHQQDEIDKCLIDEIINLATVLRMKGNMKEGHELLIYEYIHNRTLEYLQSHFFETFMLFLSDAGAILPDPGK